VGMIKSWIASSRRISVSVCSSVHPVSWTVNKTMKISIAASGLRVTSERIDEGRKEQEPHKVVCGMTGEKS